VLARIGLAASSQAHAPPLSDPRLAGAITASLGALLLADGLWITSLGGGWRIVAWAAGGLGAVAVMIGATGYMLSGWMAMSAAAAACIVTGMFAVMPLLVPGIRAQRNAWLFLFGAGALLAPWVVGAVTWAVAPAAAAKGSIAELGGAIGVYVFAWTIVKGLMVVSGDLWAERPPAAGPAAALRASLRGPALVAALVAVGLGLGDLLVRGSGLSPGGQRLTGFLLGAGAPVVAGLFFLTCSAIPALGRSLSLRAAAGVFLTAKAAVLLVFPAYLAPPAVLTVGAAAAVAGLAACAIPASPASLAQDAASLPQDQSPATAK
jgi:hypothetical protein